MNLDASESLPTTIGRYRITGKLGEGGMGVVYQALDERLARPVAIKTIHQRVSDQSATDRFQREARAAASVTHPNVCQVYEIGEDNGRLFIVMELLEGSSLAERLAGGVMTADEAIRITLDVLSALTALHARQVVHRDIKPSNVFVTPGGVKLLDFGLARTVAEDLEATAGSLTGPNLVLGTPRYMSPEHVFGRPLDARSDLFSVGTMVFEMVSGKPPFGGDSAAQTLHAVAYEPAPALTGSAAVLALDRVVRRAMAKGPADRYPSAEAMSMELRAIARHAPGPVVARRLTRLAVLPFRLLRSDPDVDFLAFSLADAITSSLSGLESLVVRSSLVGSKYLAESIDLRRMRDELDVDVMLTGTLLRSGDRLRVKTELVELPDGKVLWSLVSETRMGELFDLQDQLVERIVKSLPLSAADREIGRTDVPANPRAYELYLRANQMSYEAGTWEVARELYTQCLAEDPDFAPAWARLGRTHRVISKFGQDDVGRMLNEAERALERALSLNPELSLAHYLYAQLEVDIGRADRALERLLARAVKRRTDPDLFAGLVHACRYCGLLEASVAAWELARQLDPSIRTSVIHTFMARGEYERVIASRDEATDPVVGLAYQSLGRDEEALQAVELEQTRFRSHPAMLSFSLGVRGVLAGDPNQTKEGLAFLKRSFASGFRDGEGAYYLAQMYARVGLDDEAIEAFEQAVELGYLCAPSFRKNPGLDRTRGHARFVAAMEEAERGHLAAVEIFSRYDGQTLLGVSEVGPPAAPRKD